MRIFYLLLPVALLFTVLAQSDNYLPPGPHVEVVYGKCQTCHNLRQVKDSTGMPAFLWEDTVNLMIQLGMHVTEEEKDQLISYLSTYLGPNPPEVSQESLDLSAQATDVDGETAYMTSCSSCHQATGLGVPGAFPPLVNHLPALATAEGGKTYLANLVLYGLQGEISVRDEVYAGLMPPWGHLSDETLAAALNYALSSWGNNSLLPEAFEGFTAEDIAAQRDAALSASDVHEARPDLATGN